MISGKRLGKLPVGKNFTREMASKLEHSIKGFINKSSNLFESLKLRYFGPIDGHNITKLVDTLKDLKNIPGPKILACSNGERKRICTGRKGTNQMACTGFV